MKKLTGFIALGLAGAAAAIAASSPVAELNVELARLLGPFQNATTMAQLVFRTVETNAEHALKLEASGRYFKVGSQNQLDLNLEDLSYNYGDGSAPTTKMKLFVGTDLTKLLSQEDLNRIVPEAEKMVEGMAKEYAREYGDAVTVVAQVTEKTQDQQGNYTGVKARISGKIDLTKLPAGKTVDSVFATDADLSLSIDLKTGMRAELVIVSNPAYKAFQSDEKGLKDYLDSLLKRDEKSLSELVRIFQQLDSSAGEFVNGSKQ